LHHRLGLWFQNPQEYTKMVFWPTF
jgi:hypothetical protein